MNTFYSLWSTKTSLEVQKQIPMEIKNNYTENPTYLKQKAINMVGISIYEKLIKGSTKKQWEKDP